MARQETTIRCETPEGVVVMTKVETLAADGSVLLSLVKGATLDGAPIDDEQGKRRIRESCPDLL